MEKMRKVHVRLYVPSGRLTTHGFQITKPITVTRQLRKDEDYCPYIQYKGKNIYIRPAKYAYGCYEECERSEAAI